MRKIVFEHAGLKCTDYVPELGRTVGEELLAPTRIYAAAVTSLLRHYPVKRRVVRGLAHITGEGLEGNVPRVLPPGRRVFLKRGSWPMPPVFPLAAAARADRGSGDVSRLQHGHWFRDDRQPVLCGEHSATIDGRGVPTWVIGEVREGEPGLEFE